MKKVLILSISMIFLVGCTGGQSNYSKEAAINSIVEKATEGAIGELDHERSLARDNKRFADANFIRTFAELYYLHTGSYPSLGAEPIKSNNSDQWAEFVSMFSERDLFRLDDNEFPIDPQHPDRYYQYHIDDGVAVVTTVFENQRDGCVEIAEGMCKYEVRKVQGPSDL